jgi:hypothetical protein
MMPRGARILVTVMTILLKGATISVLLFMARCTCIH